eukprot:CAMPEP_0114620468 /NCGR_PEP_ID=MMETSP0168-20121206/8741_1 /TAXON_ID=95228 ORGANISM="Vannella sp., Strain DIVA3 517/6/12" /NCGR_SAMPLE_ID=MMETSP0168 /ASSEMBLY_ACC=CAM_ASM_000044 /LENGTH=552 /DNA_ID=CAMNT_0001831661 /DNA_START=14 /DNA_END=1672 /DNA_ORIENTATION=-
MALNVSKKVLGCRVGDCIGSGYEAFVYKAVRIRDGAPLALKVVALQRGADEDRDVQGMRVHLELLKGTNHENIVRVLDYELSNDALYILMERCDFDVHKLLGRLRKKPFSESQARTFMVQLREGLHCLRKLKIVHRDLKPENLLLTKNANGSLQLKISDFGLCKATDTSTAAMKTRCGTAAYMAPEVCRGVAYSAKADLWSVGIILHFLLTRTVPEPLSSSNPYAVCVANANGEYTMDELFARLPADLSPECRDLFECLLQRDPAERMSFDDFAQHRWFLEPAVVRPSAGKLRVPRPHKVPEQVTSKVQTPVESPGEKRSGLGEAAGLDHSQRYEPKLPDSLDHSEVLDQSVITKCETLNTEELPVINAEEAQDRLLACDAVIGLARTLLNHADHPGLLARVTSHDKRRECGLAVAMKALKNLQHLRTLVVGRIEVLDRERGDGVATLRYLLLDLEGAFCDALSLATTARQDMETTELGSASSLVWSAAKSAGEAGAKQELNGDFGGAESCYLMAVPLLKALSWEATDSTLLTTLTELVSKRLQAVESPRNA